MKQLTLLLIILVCLIAKQVNAQPGVCPIKPPPPIGSKPSDAVCICDEKNTCTWIWVKH